MNDAWSVPRADPFRRYNSITTPLYCSCTRSPLGAYSNKPFCHGQVPAYNSPITLQSGNTLEESSGRVTNLRTRQQVATFGPEQWDGYYGQAYLLRFPTLGSGRVNQSTVQPTGLWQVKQCRQGDVFYPCTTEAEECSNRDGLYRPTIPDPNSGEGALDPDGPFVLVGSRSNPYFRVFSAPKPSNLAPPISGLDPLAVGNFRPRSNNLR